MSPEHLLVVVGRLKGHKLGILPPKRGPPLRLPEHADRRLRRALNAPARFHLRQPPHPLGVLAPERLDLALDGCETPVHVLAQLLDALSRAGYAPVVTGDPEETLRLVEAEKPDLVILDLMLPGTDGIELMKDILEMADVPIIFLSAYGRDELIARAFDMGAVDYVVKPFSPTELTARIRAALRRREVSEPSEPYVLGIQRDIPHKIINPQQAEAYRLRNNRRKWEFPN